MKKYRAVALIAGVLAAASVSSRASAQVAPASDSATIDAGSGVRVHAIRGAGGVLTLEAAASDVSVRKDVSAGRSTTVIRAGDDAVTLVVDRNGVTVETDGQRITVPKGQPERIRLVTAALAGSPAVTRAIAMLARLQLAQDSPAGQAFLITRALLQSAKGDPGATLQLADGLHRAAVRPRIVLASTGSSPTQCWNDYTAAADAAWAEYTSCFDAASWWDVFTKSECATLYDIEAEGAFSWYLNCVGVQVY